MATLTIFANFYIDSDERYLRMVDSFNSFSDIAAEKWVINARGLHAKKTMDFLTDKLGEKLVPFELESSQGWLHDTKQMLEAIKTDYVFLWLEDHINLVDVQIYNMILSEMYENGSEYLEYSWWHFGQPLKTYQDVIENESSHIYTFTHTKETLHLVEQKHSTFIISMVSIFSRSLFCKIINETPLFLRQYPKLTPFNFEKGAGHTSWLPIKVAIPKEELFANIDDDHSDPGYSLQSRGLYPVREKRAAGPTFQKIKKANIFKKTLPTFIYKRLIAVVIFINKVKRYFSLVLQGK